jgi:hypothetical protein
MTIFLRLLADKHKEGALLSGCTALRNGLKNNRLFYLASDSFRTVPGSPFAYWVSDAVRSSFIHLPQISSYGVQGEIGAQTSNNFRFLRTWWERNGEDLQGWIPYAKGGGYSEFYGEISLLVKATNNFDEIVAYANHAYPYLNGKARSLMHADEENFGQIGITWTKSTTSDPSFRFLPIGSSYSDTGPVAGGISADESDLMALSAIMNSSPFKFLLTLSLGLAAEGRKHYEIGIVNKNPLPWLEQNKRTILARLARRAWSLKRTLDTTEETSHTFTLPILLRARLGDYVPIAIEAELEHIHTEIDVIAFDLYGFSEDDCDAVKGYQVAAIESATESSLNDEADDEDSPVPINQMDGLLSWAVGVAFGRFDWRVATGECVTPAEPEPFDPLPSKSPGMLGAGVAPFHAQTGILVDDSGNPHDLARLVEEVLASVDFPVPSDVRRWLRRDFFAFHLRRYSKSRRKAPIYWPLSTASGSYILWIYYPSLNNQTLFTVVNDFLDGPNGKLTQVSRECAELRMKGISRSSDEEKQYETLQFFEQELTDLRDTLLNIAPSYQPNHDDGVQITAAPLWPLFRHKPWQKVLKDTWVKLEKGDYDWAHLAMAYWPDRVREKCKTDKSLAIAHGLEELYVEPEVAPKKKKGKSNA